MPRLGAHSAKLGNLADESSRAKLVVDSFTKDFSSID